MAMIEIELNLMLLHYLKLWRGACCGDRCPYTGWFLLPPRIRDFYLEGLLKDSEHLRGPHHSWMELEEGLEAAPES
ncbi:hypothetical protein VULLAG_LOCUS382 [Vulpes lagopus]